MDKRFKNLTMIIGGIIIVLAIVFVVLPALGSNAVSFEKGIIQLNAIVENNGVPILRFHEGKIFSLTDDGTIENNFSEQQFLKLKSDLRDFKGALPEESASEDAKSLHTAVGLYIDLIELNEQKKAIYEKIIALNQKDPGCGVLSEMNSLLNLEKEYEISTLEFALDSGEFVLEHAEKEGIENALLLFDADLSADDITLLQESVIVLEESCP